MQELTKRMFEKNYNELSYDELLTISNTINQLVLSNELDLDTITNIAIQSSINKNYQNIFFKWFRFNQKNVNDKTLFKVVKKTNKSFNFEFNIE